MLEASAGRHKHYIIPLGTSETVTVMTRNPQFSANQEDGSDQHEMATLPFSIA